MLERSGRSERSEDIGIMADRHDSERLRGFGDRLTDRRTDGHLLF